jgi:hypothetical protein
MSKIANASINSFASQTMQANVPQAEEPVFILTSHQLQDLITQAVTEAIQPLQDEVSQLRVTVARQDEKIAALQATQDTHADNSLIQLRLINTLREDVHKDSGPSAGELERVAKIEKLCTDAPGHMISLPELRGRLGLDKAVLSRLMKRVDHDRFYLRQSKTDKRIRYLCLRPEVR